MTTGEILVLAAVIGIIPASIAHRKGESFLGWWVFGTLLFIVALPMALVLKPSPWAQLERRGLTPTMIRPCPACLQPMPRGFKKCELCGAESEPWVFHDGHWWLWTERGEWLWFDESDGRFHRPVER